MCLMNDGKQQAWGYNGSSWAGMLESYKVEIRNCSPLISDFRFQRMTCSGQWQWLHVTEAEKKVHGEDGPR